MENKEYQVNLTINCDSTGIDEAINKLKELITLLEKVEQLTQKNISVN